MEIHKLNNYPKNNLLYIHPTHHLDGWENNSCLFGIADFSNELQLITEIPATITAFYTYFGEGNLSALTQLIEQGINNNLTHLLIGFVHPNKNFGYKDYTLISELLSKTYFPKLKSFEYGIDFLLANEETVTPNLGDLTQVLKNMPHLENLDICGSFSLNESIQLKNLRKFNFSDYSCDEENPLVSIDTITYLTQSHFENLEDFDMSLTSEENIYHFSDGLFCENKSNLKKVAIEGHFESGTKKKLILQLSHLGDKLLVNEIQEPINPEIEAINKLLYEVPNHIDYTEFPDELDQKDISTEMISRVHALMLHEDFDIQFRSAWLLTSWGDDEAYQTLISILYRDDLMSNDAYMPHRLHSYNEAYPQIIQAIISYRAHQKDNGNLNVVNTIKEPLTYIIKKSNKHHFPIDRIYRFSDENESLYYLPYVKEHLEQIITNKDLNYWRIHDGLKFILLYDKTWVDDLLKQHKLKYKYFNLEAFDTQKKSFWQSIFGN